MSIHGALDLIPAFQAVMRGGSLSAAARSLHLSQPTVRRQVEALEARLGASLFTRAANGLTPTPLALTLLPRAEAVLEEAAALERLARNAGLRPEGVVRLTASRILASHVLPPLLVELRALAPDLRFELAATDSSENLARRAADIAIRFAEPRQLNLVVRRLPAVEVGLFTAPGGPRPARLEELAQVPFILDDREAQILPALEAAGLPAPQNLVLRCDDPLAQLAHLRAGLGVGLCQVRLGARLGLERVLPEVSHPMPAWLAVHEDQARLAPIALTLRHLGARLPEIL